MTAPWLCMAFSIGLLGGNGEAPSEGRLRPAYLRVEYRVNPLGIDVARPRLSWIVESARRGERQTAYRVLVASSPEELARNRGDLWDSGRVESAGTSAVVYGGGQLQSRTRCHWKVRVWDRDGESSAWSEPAVWSMGLLRAVDWKAKWIGYDRPAVEPAGSARHPIERANWIWYAEGDPAVSVPTATRYFRRVVALPEGRRARRAELAVAADNQSTIHVNGEEIGTANSFAAATAFDVSDVLRPGRNVIAISVRNVGEAPNPAGLLGALRVELADGEPVEVVTDASWRVADRAVDAWTGPQPRERGWGVPRVVGPNGTPPWPKVALTSLRLPPPRYLRSEFVLSKPVRRAMIHASALGLYALRLNGAPVGDAYFTPGWTDYERRVYYNTYDVTDGVRTGRNALAAVIADGWYAGYVGFGGGRDHYGNRIRLLAQLEVEYEDGSRLTIGSGPEWRASTGPLLHADFLMGEAFDARKVARGWDRPDFDDSGWHAVDVSPSVPAELGAYPAQPVREIAELSPTGVTEPRPGNFVFDLGQNFAGIVRLRVSGAQAGQTITLRHAEMLNPDGTLYTANLRSARATDTYICRGDDSEEVWQPRFTFHGFRYVEVSGFPGRPTARAITGLPLSSDTPVVGSFECSSDLVNQLFSNIYWTQRMNFIDIPTDCPQRDERLGWTGDAQVYIRTACMITDTQAFFSKWLVDLADAQREDGQFPMVAPLKSRGVSADGGPAWADAGVICPWTIYDVYGDRRLLRRHYDGMKRFVAFCRDRCTDDLLPPESFHCFGDWLSIRADTPKDVIYMAYFAHSTRLTARAAEALGMENDAAELLELLARIKDSFNRNYVDDDGRIRGDTQTCYVLALQFDLLDGERRDLAARHLVGDIRERDWHLSTGFIGTKDLMLVLSKIGRHDVAYRLLENTTFPSWGFSIRHGATTIWERWNGWTPDGGFFDPGMNSFAHYSFGAVYQWMVETVGGIRSDGPGYREIVIRPHPGGGLTRARVGYRSIHGEIVSEWKRGDGRLELLVTVPANTSARVHVPTSDASQVTEAGRPAREAEGVEPLGRGAGEAIFRVGSGTYRFGAPTGER